MDKTIGGLLSLVFLRQRYAAVEAVQWVWQQYRFWAQRVALGLRAWLVTGFKI